MAGGQDSARKAVLVANARKDGLVFNEISSVVTDVVPDLTNDLAVVLVAVPQPAYLCCYAISTRRTVAQTVSQVAYSSRLYVIAKQFGKCGNRKITMKRISLVIVLAGEVGAYALNPFAFVKFPVSGYFV